MRPFPRHAKLCAILGTSLLLFGAAANATAEDFRVDTRIYQDDQREPISQNITRFRGNVVWDFAGDGSEIIMFDRARGRFAALDVGRRLKTDLTTDGVLQFAEQLRDWALAQDDPLLKFCASPKFEPTTTTEDGSLTFAAPMMTYRVVAEQAPKPEFAADYRAFSDWYGRLNTVFAPATIPPFPRLVVNEHLARGQQIPREVQLTLPPQKRFGNRQVVLKSEHEFRFGLAQSDLAEIETASRYLVTFRTVSIGEYRQQTAAP